MRLCERWGLLPDLSQAYAQTQKRPVQTRDQLAPSVPTAQNPAKQLAQALYGRIPLIYGSCGHPAPPSPCAGKGSSTRTPNNTPLPTPSPEPEP